MAILRFRTSASLNDREYLKELRAAAYEIMRENVFFDECCIPSEVFSVFPESEFVNVPLSRESNPPWFEGEVLEDSSKLHRCDAPACLRDRRSHRNGCDG